MTVITGDLILVTDRPSAVTEVWIRAGEIRTHDGGLVLEDRDREPIHDGWLEINVLPGPAILTLVSHGTVRKAIPIVVPDAEATSLEDAVNAAKLAQPSLKAWLEELAASIIAGTKGPKGGRGPEGKKGPAGPAPYIQNGTWWTGGVDTGIDATGPQGDPGIAPHIQGETWWVGEVDTGIRAQGPKGDPGPTGTLDLIDESAQTTIDTVVVPAIEGARDEALGQVADAVAVETVGIREDMVPRQIVVDSLIGDGGQFRNRTPWAASGGTLLHHNSAAIVTGDGTSAVVGTHRDAGRIPEVQGGHTLYIRVNVRSKSVTCQALRVRLVSSAGEVVVARIDTPQHMGWQVVNGLAVIPDSWGTGPVNIHIEGLWATAAAAAGQEIEANALTWIDITSAYGAGNEPALRHVTRQKMETPADPIISPTVWDSNYARASRAELADTEEALSVQVTEVTAGIAPKVAELSYMSTVAATNLLGNGFITQPAWTATPGSVLSIGGGSGIATSSGTTSPLGMRRATPITAQAGDVLWLDAYMRARNFQATAYKIQVTDGSTTINVSLANPAHLSWVAVTGTVTLPESMAGKPLTVSVVAESTAITSGSIVEVYAVAALNLTAMYGSGNEPESGVVAGIVAGLPPVAPHGRVDGTVQNFHRDPVVVTKKALPDLLEGYVPPPASAESHIRHNVGGVILRFDDGFENVRTIAAPYMKARGLVGYMAACCGWAGTTQPAGKIMQNQQLVELHDMGWEIGNHAYEHADAIGHTNFNGQIDQNSQAIMDLGLPYPNTMTYPNGSRSVTTDRNMYLRFNQAQLTSAPEFTPAKIDQPVFYTGWVVVSGVATPPAKAREVARAKRYIANSVRQHQVPVLAFHQVLPQGETPTLNWQLDWETFTELMDWIHDQGYRTLLPRDLRPHNLVGDAGFNEFEVVGYQANAYPWAISPPLDGWQRVTTGQGSGLAAMKIATTAETTAHVIQAIPVEAGQYKVHANIKVDSVTAGDIRIRLVAKTATRDTIGQDLVPITVGSPTSGYQLFSGVVGIPEGVDVVQVVATASGFVGTAFVDHVAVSPAHLFDPLAI